VTARILHVSDLHTGGREDPGVEAALQELAARVGPEVVVASGDLSNRGRPAELERAHALLGGLGVPVLAVPGNHDLPYTFPARFTGPRAPFEAVWGTTEPTYGSPTLHVVGLDSARPFRHQGGALDSAQLARATERLGAAAPGACRVVALHHHLLGAPWRAARKFPLSNRDGVLDALAAAGAELILSGHIHQSAVAERREFEVVGDAPNVTVVAVAPGLTRPRPNRTGEAQGLQVYEIDQATIAVETHLWTNGGYASVARREFRR
jgi:3',5'-cyclic AMP phosphodiesterase CpdA